MPVLRTPPNLPNDRVLSGRIHNGGLRRTRLIPRDLTLVDAHGKVVPSSAIFLSGYLHELYPPTREPSAGLSDVERRRIGRLATLSPGQTVAVTIAWRLKPGQDPPKTAQVKGGSTLPIP